MEFEFVADAEGQQVKRLLKRFGISKNLLARVKFDGGEIFVNGREENAIYPLSVGDDVKIVVPDEPANPELIAEDFPLEIIYEDEDYLVINKPTGFPSITGREKPTGSISNFVAGYLQATHQPNQTVHLVSRLDRGTSGLQLFAKHSYAHALMNNGKGRDSYEKRYYAVIAADKRVFSEKNTFAAADSSWQHYEPSGKFLSADTIDAPIGRRETSIIERCVRFDGLWEAKNAQTSYETLEIKNDLRLLDVLLHTGRTHQIRVHFAYLGYPLIGDALYGGDTSVSPRQALHCHSLKFENLIRHKKIELEIPLAADISAIFNSS